MKKSAVAFESLGTSRKPAMGSGEVPSPQELYWQKNIEKIRESLKPDFDALNVRHDGHDQQFALVRQRFDQVQESLELIKKKLEI